MNPLEAPIGFGRGAIVLPGQQPPDRLGDAPRIRVDHHTLALKSEAGRKTIDRLHAAWATRQPVVVELAVDPGELLVDEVTEQPAYDLGVDFLFPRERLKYLVWANNVDCRHPSADHPEGRWWHSVKAVQQHGCTLAQPDGPGDVLTRDGLAMWIDGGPKDGIQDALAVLHRDDLEAGRHRPLGHGADPDLLDALTSDQRAVILAGHGAIRVPAPAGSGKTRVLTARLSTLLAQRHHDPAAILTLVYNTRAAVELRERVQNGTTTINTVHAHAFGLVKRMMPGIRVLNEREVRQILSRIVPHSPLANQDPYAPWIEAFDAIRAGLLHPVVAADTYRELPNLMASFGAYQQFLRDNQAVDFAEMVPWATDLLLTNPQLRHEEQAKAREILVDEFQDLTPAYLLYIRLLASPQLAVLGVGDDDQVIYGHAGAKPDFLINFDRFFPGSTSQILTINHRCPKAVVRQTNTLLSHNKTRISKNIQPFAMASEEPVRVHLVKAEHEADQAKGIITDLIEQGVGLDEIAVLARVNVALLPIQAALTQAGIRVRSPLTEGLLDRSAVRAALTYTRLGLEQDMAGSDLAEILHKPLRAIPGQVKAQLQGRRWNVDDLRSMDLDLGTYQQKAWQAFVSDLGSLRRMARQQPSARVLGHIMYDIDLASVAKSLEGQTSEGVGSSHTDDLLALKLVAKYCPDLDAFEPFLRQMVRPPAQDGQAVTLSSIHKVKGLEWPYVMLIAANEGTMPHRRSLGSDRALEEERRVFHVGITRAKQALHIIGTTGSSSRFIAEMQGKVRKRPTKSPSKGDTKAGQGMSTTSTRSSADGQEDMTKPPVGRKPQRTRLTQHPLVKAVVGLKVRIPGGLTGEIVQIAHGRAFLQTQSRAVLQLASGTQVYVDGKLSRLLVS